MKRIKIFADGADLDGIRELAKDERISGFTTNPTLMRRAGVEDYESFARSVLAAVASMPVCFEVFSDEPEEMRRQAKIIAGWGENVYVKIPVTTTTGTSTAELVRDLTADGIALNVTALTTLAQVQEMANSLAGTRAGIISVFAGRVADTGTDPLPLMSEALSCVSGYPNQELLWASPREIYNLVQAQGIGCDIITVTHELLRKLSGIGRDLEEVSLDTVRMFHRDAAESGFAL